MFQTVIAVLIGLSFLYFILAVLCSGIKEFYAGIFNLRASTLEDGIGRMLDSAKKPGGLKAFFAKLLPFISLDTPKGGVTSDFYAHPLIRDLAKDGQQPSYIPAEYFSAALEAVLRARDIGSADFPGLIKNLPDGDLKKKLSTLAAQAGNDVAALRKSVEGWFNNTMDRVSGWYKRQAQVIMFFAALVLVVAVNADTVSVARTLWQNPAVRDSAVAAAVNAQKANTPNPTPEQARQQLKTLADINQFPIGWSKAAVPDSWGEWGLRLGGWLLSAFAATLGAPFWFDAMNKLVNLRASGAPPQRTAAPATPTATVVVQTEPAKTKAAGAGA